MLGARWVAVAQGPGVRELVPNTSHAFDPKHPSYAVATGAAGLPTCSANPPLPWLHLGVGGSPVLDVMLERPLLAFE